ncbi:MAG: endonuclease MutS2 [Spirochaetales bacterium]|uniref:Endonuclease MutS2 n=1 Tax=Candidatus Thalassospirochaeta sargassi TaxID=3119039 RepID=A0AAJ1ID80_9SPIO|nr:endonuclease MutS2 [Spirochaetales bacterium]
MLEFDIIREMIAGCAKSPGGASLIRAQGFETEADKLDQKKNIVSDWKTLLNSDIKDGIDTFPEINFIDKLSKSGTVLEGAELADAAEYIRAAAKMKSFCAKKPENLNLNGALEAESKLLPDIIQYSKEIYSEINPDGSVKDNHPLLKSARSRIAGLHGRINRITSGYMNDDREIWQSASSTQRDGRIVLPLKANFKGRIKGLVHEVSSTGATVFIEPFDLVDLNNEMAYEQGMLNQQIVKIYRGLTEKLREASGDFRVLIEQVSYIDSWYARAIFSIRNNCIRPLSREKGLIINKGRHPLLGKNAVPISLSFADDTILIITGPNAGGKTVTLKTCGLFVLLNQFACELPAEEGTEIGLYENIYADIGDDQSIEESLSTFSGHMKRISEIVYECGEKSLVLLDELGSGTDPSQGAAIAMAVLDNMRAKGISTIVTSHHAAVKNFGYTRKGAVNASVSFDAETLSPTYEIIEGVPGESHAVEIAQSMGLPDGIVSEAEKYLENGDSTVSEMIRELENRQFQILERDRRLAEEEARNREDRRKLDLTRLKLKQAEHQINQQDYSKLKTFVKESRKELENLVRELREGEITKEKTRRVKEHIASLNEKLDKEKKKIDDNETELFSDDSSTGNEALSFEPGLEVRYKKNNKSGVIVEPRKNKSWLVAFGNIKLTINEKELIPEKSKNNKMKTPSLGRSGYNSSAVFELDLRGMRVYEAEAALIKQIDTALLSGLSDFSIIHGLGEGVLQKTVQDFLKTCSAVKGFEYSDPEHGGFGKTIVRL